MSDVSHHPVNGNGPGRELVRTAGYLVLSRQRGEALYADLLRSQTREVRMARTVTSLHARLEETSNQLVHALHELALTRQEKEPQLFIRRWLRDHREVNADERKEARLLG